MGMASDGQQDCCELKSAPGPDGYGGALYDLIQERGDQSGASCAASCRCTNQRSEFLRGGSMKNFTEKQVLKAVHGSAGLIQCVASQLNCSWSTARKYIGKYENCVDAFDSELQMMLDIAENTIHEAIKEKDLQVCKWYLCNKGKARGYGDKAIESEIQDSLQVNVKSIGKEPTMNIENLSKKETKQLTKLYCKMNCTT